MAEEKGRDEGAQRQGYIPRPPSREELDRVSGQQGLITDEWTGPSPTEGPKPEDGPAQETEGQPS